jgi:transposase
MPITLVMDNARYGSTELAEVQRCRLVQELAVTLNIELLFLPSCSPNLNLIERLWKFTKKQVLNSRHQKCFADFQREIDKCLDELSTTYRVKIALLMTLNFQSFEKVSMLAA